MTRDDLFTTIHKALRKGLFDVTVRAGATDWTDPADVAAFRAEWLPLLDLLRSHNRHEDAHVLTLLDGRDAAVLAATAEQHDDLEDLLADLATRIEEGDPATGLAVYRDLARYVAGYLQHLHFEETVVMPHIWAACTDEQIAAARAALLAEITPEERDYTMRLLLPALDPQTRELLAAAAAR